MTRDQLISEFYEWHQNLVEFSKSNCYYKDDDSFMIVSGLVLATQKPQRYVRIRMYDRVDIKMKWSSNTNAETLDIEFTAVIKRILNKESMVVISDSNSLTIVVPLSSVVNCKPLTIEECLTHHDNDIRVHGEVRRDRKEKRDKSRQMSVALLEDGGF